MATIVFCKPVLYIFVHLFYSIKYGMIEEVQLIRIGELYLLSWNIGHLFFIHKVIVLILSFSPQL